MLADCGAVVPAGDTGLWARHSMAALSNPRPHTTTHQEERQNGNPAAPPTQKERWNAFTSDDAGVEDQTKDDGEKKLADTVIEQVEAKAHGVFYTKRPGPATPPG